MATIDLATLCSVRGIASPDRLYARNGLVFRFSNGQSFNGFVLRHKTFPAAEYVIAMVGAHGHRLHAIQSRPPGGHPLSLSVALHPLPGPSHLPLARFNRYGRLLNTAANLRIVSVSGQTVRRGRHVIQFLGDSGVHSRAPVPMD